MIDDNTKEENIGDSEKQKGLINSFFNFICKINDFLKNK